jgi:hypothetical protein
VSEALNALAEGELVEDLERLRDEAALSNATIPATQRSKWVAIDAGYEDSLADLLKLRFYLRQDGVESAAGEDLGKQNVPRGRTLGWAVRTGQRRRQSGNRHLQHAAG